MQEEAKPNVVKDWLIQLVVMKCPSPGEESRPCSRSLPRLELEPRLRIRLERSRRRRALQARDTTLAKA